MVRLSDDDNGLPGLPIQPPRWTPADREAVERSLTGGMPSPALAFFARWWQLETWLRQLAYLELRAAMGHRWTDPLSPTSRRRASKDRENEYMASPDRDAPLAYLDSAQLLDLIESEEVWPLLEASLLPKKRWQGMVDELRSLRNRNAHMRRPHPDDLPRIEQALRNLEPGARKAMEAFNRQHPMDADLDDPLAAAWVRGDHADAKRLLRHAERQYGVDFSLSYSARPWARAPKDEAISGTRGLLVHASWTMHDGRFLSPRKFWQDRSLDGADARDLLLYVTHDSEWHVSISFAAVDGAKKVADAIGAAFDTLLMASERHVSEATRERWIIDSMGLDPRVQVGTALTLAYDDQPFSVFGA